MTKNTKLSFLNQIQRNSVALISLVIAVTSLSYNTWRNELTESNRNQRLAAFEILLKLNELQQVVFHHRFDKDVKDKGNPRTGWTYVLTIQDFSLILQQPVIDSAKQLVDVWGQQWETFAINERSYELITLNIDIVRKNTLGALKSLD